MSFPINKQLIRIFNSTNLRNLMKLFFSSFVIFTSVLCTAQSTYRIITSDIDNFWSAYDSLIYAQTKEDSLSIIQVNYIDKATEEFKEFIKARNFTAKEYVRKIGAYSNFWRTIRANTENIQHRKSEITEVFNSLKQKLPDFKEPKVCFAIGCLRTGGTISGDLILIGSEIASSDDKVDVSELTPWLQSVMGNTGDITSMIAHETIHIQQVNKVKYTLLTGTMAEGSSDFITQELLGRNINQLQYEYGLANECELKEEFWQDLKSDPKDYSKWIYNGTRSVGRPADLGYFIGFRIAESYYRKQTDKTEALKVLLNQKKYKKIFKESKYKEESCN